jgi:glucose-6-phosphate 1-epimerase
MITLDTGRNGLPRLRLATPDGAEAEVYLHGAHLTSWRPAGGEEALFLSDAAVFAPGEPIRGGVPVVFPQFSGEGPLPKHGIARTVEWEWVNREEAESATRAVLRLTDDAASRTLWPHAFLLELSVAPRGDSLALRLTVENRGDEPFDFAAALHTYLRVSDIRRTTVVGLEGTRYRSRPEGVANAVDGAAVLSVSGEIDRLYRDAPRELAVNDAGARRTFQIVEAGFRDAVVWNPWSELAASISDMEDEEYERMLCVEAAQVEAPVTLAPGAAWRGEQRLRCVRAGS